jgi:TonB family protein
MAMLGLTAGGFAQGNRHYLDGNYHPVDNSQSARYYRESMHGPDGMTLVRLHYTDGTLKMEGSYSDNKLTVANGTFSFYYHNGQLESQGEFCNGKKCGVWKRWSWDGSQRADRVYPDVHVEPTAMNEPAQFPGGYDALLNYIAENTVYPSTALNKKITGMVKISFSIDEGGLVRDIEVVERNASVLADAALQCMWDMPLWEPAKRNGRNVASTFILPIVFTIEDAIGQVRVGS